MAEEQKTDAAPETPAVNVTINAQYVKDLSFENPNAPRVLVSQQGAPNVAINIEVSANGFGNDTFEAILKIRAEAKTEALTAFVLELSYAGLVTLKNVAPEQVQPILFVEIPKLLFPFAREIIADTSRQGGFPPLLLNPVDFGQMYMARVAQDKAAQEAPASETVN